MKQPRYKIYKQVGIHDLVPFKSNVKLFRHLLVAKYTFLYFFYREFVNRKFNRLRINLKRYVQPFLSPIVKKLFSNYDKKFKNSPNYKGRVVKSFDTESSNIKKVTYDYAQHNRFNTMSKQGHYRHWLKPNRYFKKRNTKLPKKNMLVNNELLDTYFGLFPNSSNTPSTLNYNTMKSPWLNFFLMSHKLYLKLSFVNLEQTQVKFERLSMKRKIRNRTLSLVKRLKSYRLKKLTGMLKHNINSYRSICLSLPLFFRMKSIVRAMLHKHCSKKLIKGVNALSSIYYYTKKYNDLRSDLNRLRTKFILDYSDEHFNNIGWFSLMEYFFPRFVQSGYKIFMHKDFINRFLINPYIYKKYLSELARSETFIQFSQKIMNYKQRRGMRKFFVHLYRQRYRKVRHKPFHGLNSYYRVTYRIMSFLLNRPAKRYRFYFNSHRIKLFQVKLIKALYKLKRTKDCMKHLKHNKGNSKLKMIPKVITWKRDLNEFMPEKTNLLRNNTVFKWNTPTVLGDRFNIVNMNGTIYNLSKYEQFNFFRLVHFYLNLFPLFDNNKLTLFRGFGKYTFFLDAIKYKLGYIISKHLYYASIRNRLVIPSKIKKNIVPIRENNSTYYVHISSPYIYFNNKYIYMGEPFDLQKANLDEFYKFRFSLLRGNQSSRRRKNSLLEFLNHFQYRTPHYMKIYHNKFHILRYIQFMKGLKSYLTFNFTHNFLIGKYSLIIISPDSSNDKHVLNMIENKLHANKVEELIVGTDNFNSIQPSHLN